MIAFIDKSSVITIPVNPKSSRSKLWTEIDKDAGFSLSNASTILWLTKTASALALIPASKGLISFSKIVSKLLVSILIPWCVSALFP